MRQRQDELDAVRAAVLIVSFESPARVRAYVRLHKVPFLTLADPSRRVYAAFGMARGPWWRIYGPRVLWQYAKAFLRGRRVHIQGDTLQRGGDFVVGPDGALRFGHVAEDSFDRPSVETLVRAVLAAVEAG